MKIDIKKRDHYTILEIFGRIDTMTAGGFEAEIMEVLEKESDLILDCHGLEYISSSGLRVFLLAQKKTKATGGSLKLCNLQPFIKEVFDISGFSSIFAIYQDLDEAMQA
jgi:anti-sigma B factor antagonist